MKIWGGLLYSKDNQYSVLFYLSEVQKQANL